jgi:molybdenum cofactor cytidylyltransferase
MLPTLGNSWKYMSDGHDAVVLAAGGSRRLGRPKQMLTINGETLLARASRLVTATRPRKLVVVLGAYADVLRSQVPHGAVVNTRWESGMASSLQLAAECLAGRDLPILLTVVDQPALGVEHLEALIAAYDGQRDIATGYAGARGVPAFVRASTMRLAANLTGDEGFRRLWLDDEPLCIQADALGDDLDTEADVRRAIQAGMLDATP